MATITVKNVPDDLYIKLKATASFNRRSINNEVIFCIENMIKSRKVNPDDFINQLENFYTNIDIPLLTDKKLKAYKESGRL
jgi:antitoxin FitA